MNGAPWPYTKQRSCKIRFQGSGVVAQRGLVSSLGDLPFSFAPFYSIATRQNDLLNRPHSHPPGFTLILLYHYHSPKGDTTRMIMSMSTPYTTVHHCRRSTDPWSISRLWGDLRYVTGRAGSALTVAEVQSSNGVFTASQFGFRVLHIPQGWKVGASVFAWMNRHSPHVNLRKEIFIIYFA